jgi:hypothetical protein
LTISAALTDSTAFLMGPDRTTRPLTDFDSNFGKFLQTYAESFTPTRPNLCRSNIGLVKQTFYIN